MSPKPDHDLPEPERRPDRPDEPDRPDKPEKPEKPAPKPTPYGAKHAERPDYPRPLVRLRFAPGGFTAEVRMVASAEEEAQAKGDGGGGWQTIDVPEHDPDWQEFPKFVTRDDGVSGVVYSRADEDRAREPRGAWPSTPQQPPTPVDRGPDR